MANEPIDPTDQVLYSEDLPGTANASIDMPGGGATPIRYVPTIFAGYSDLMGFHRHLLDDASRTSAFVRAVEQTVKPGDIVIDIGTGTGVLAIAACRAGASRVYAIEHASIIRLAKELAHRNGCGDSIVFVKQDARRLAIAEKADVIVSECFGLAGVGGTMIPIVTELAARHLRPGGTVIPRRLRVLLAPVESHVAHQYVHCWTTPRYGVDFEPAQTLAYNNVYVATFAEANLLAPAQVAATVDLHPGLTGLPLRVSLQFPIARECALHGFAAWFDAELCSGIAVDSGPSAPPTVWQQSFFPLEREVRLGPGAGIELEFAALRQTAGLPMVFEWRTAVIGESGERGSAMCQSTAKSFP